MSYPSEITSVRNIRRTERAAMPTEEEAPPETLRPEKKDFTLADFVAALGDSFKAVHGDMALRLDAMSSLLENHASNETTQLEVIGFNVQTIQRDVDTLVQNYKNVSLRLTDHDGRIGRLEQELAQLKRRADQLQAEILELKASST